MQSDRNGVISWKHKFLGRMSHLSFDMKSTTWKTLHSTVLQLLPVYSLLGDMFIKLLTSNDTDEYTDIEHDALISLILLFFFFSKLC
jgi:hypothetical protein